MAKLNAAQFTTAGLNAAADLFAHQKNNKISHMSISTTNYIGKDISGLNKLTNEILVVTPSAMRQSGNVYTVTGAFDSTRVSADSTINSIGIYILDNSGLEVLLAVVTAAVPDFITAGGTSNHASIVYDINIAVVNSGITFDLTIDDDALAQMSDIADAKSYASSLVSTLNTTVVHNTGDEKISGTKTFLSTIIGSISGNAVTATKLETARTITLTGDVGYSTSFDGSGNVTDVATIDQTAVSSKSYQLQATTAASLNTTTLKGWYYVNSSQDLANKPYSSGAYYVEQAGNGTQLIQRAYSEDSTLPAVYRTYNGTAWTDWRGYI